MQGARNKNERIIKKMATRGRMKYIPKNLLQEMHDTKIDLGIQKDALAFKEVANNAKIGRELDRIFFASKRKKRYKRVK